MAIAKISSWLNDPRRDYTFGLLLYDHYGKSVLLKAFFKNGDSQYHLDRLITALEELNETIEEVTNTSTFRIPAVEDIVIPAKRYSITDEAWEKLPEQIKDLYVQNSKLHRHSQMIFDQARIAKTDEERLAFGVQILGSRMELNSNWSAIKDFAEKGKLRGQIKEQGQISVDELSIYQLIKHLNNLPTYLSKDRKAVKKSPDGSAKNKILLRIQENEVLLELIKNRLEGMR